MKKSAMEEIVNRRARNAEGARVLMALIEKAGVTWDPEGPEMAERLHAVDVCGVPGFQGDQWVLAVCRNFVRVRLATKDEVTLAADLYNRRHDFERIAQEMTALHDRCLEDEITRHSDEWLAAQLERWSSHLRSPIQ